MRRAPGIDRGDYIGHDIHGRTVGIIGLGQIGSRIAELCGGLFAMKVLAYDPYLDAAQITARGADKVTLEELLGRSDFVSVNCPRTTETRGMIGAGEFALMPSHACFVTTARGGIHDEEALAAVLERRGIAGAGLDVWDPEPPRPDHPLLRFDTVIASPHTAGVTHEARATWRASPPSRCWRSWTESGRRGCSTPRSGRPTRAASSASSGTRRRVDCTRSPSR